MAERDRKKIRRCSRCGRSFPSMTAAQIRTHFTGCSKIPGANTEEVKTLKKEA